MFWVDLVSLYVYSKFIKLTGVPAPSPCLQMLTYSPNHVESQNGEVLPILTVVIIKSDIIILNNVINSAITFTAVAVTDATIESSGRHKRKSVVTDSRNSPNSHSNSSSESPVSSRAKRRGHQPINFSKRLKVNCKTTQELLEDQVKLIKRQNELLEEQNEISRERNSLLEKLIECMSS